VFNEWKDNLKIFGEYAEAAAERLRRMNEAAEKAAKQRESELKAQGSWVSSIINGWTQRLGDLSEASEETFRKVALDADATRKSIAGATDATNLMRIATQNLAAGGIIRWANELAIQALRIELSFKGQAQSADRLSESLEKVAEKGGVTAGAMQQLVRQAEAAKISFSLLDQERLDRLQDAIDGANDKLREMQEETQSAKDRLQELNAELAEARGEDQKAKELRQQLDYQQALADIEAQRQEAELSGNRELLAILAKQQQVLEQINRTKIANIEADAAEQAQSRSNTTTTPTNNVTTPINRAGGGKTYNLNLVGLRGQTLSATADTDPSAFLTALEDAQRRGMIQ
jgi:chromosome segregation ATPase